MKIIKSYSEIIPTMKYKDMLELVSTAGRTCYKSAQRETRELMCEVLEKFKEQYPVFFEDL